MGPAFGAYSDSNTVTFNGASAAVVEVGAIPKLSPTVPNTISDQRNYVGGVASNTNFSFTVPPPQTDEAFSPTKRRSGTHVTGHWSGFRSTRGSSRILSMEAGTVRF